MSILPQSKSPNLLTGSSLLDEEVPAMSKKGVDIHTVVRANIGLESHVLTRHVLPTKRNVKHACRTASLLLQSRYRRALPAANFRQTVGLASVQLAIADVVRENDLQLIHSHWARPGGTAACVAKEISDVPLVISLRGADVLQEDSIGYGMTRDPFYVRRLRAGFDRADKILGVSKKVIERAIELGAAPEKTMVIPKGVHHDRFTPGDRKAAREQLGMADRPTVLFVGSLGERKGIKDLLEAFRLMRSAVPDCQLVICGKGELEGHIRSFAAEFSLTNDIILAGYIGRKELPTYFHACDVFVLPSLAEGSGNVILEAAACARPAVGTRVGGIPEYIDDEVTGLLCEKRCPESLAEKLTTILSDEQLASRMGRIGRQRVEENFRYEQMIDRTIAVYHELIDGRSRS